MRVEKLWDLREEFVLLNNISADPGAIYVIKQLCHDNLYMYDSYSTRICVSPAINPCKNHIRGIIALNKVNCFLFFFCMTK